MLEALHPTYDVKLNLTFIHFLALSILCNLYVLYNTTVVAH